MALQKNIPWIMAGCLLLFFHQPHFQALFALDLFEKLVVTYSVVAFFYFLHGKEPPSMVHCYIACDQLLFSNLKHGIIHYTLSTAAFLCIFFLSQALLFSPTAAVAAGQIILYASLLRIAYHRTQSRHARTLPLNIPANDLQNLNAEKRMVTFSTFSKKQLPATAPYADPSRIKRSP